MLQTAVAESIELNNQSPRSNGGNAEEAKEEEEEVEPCRVIHFYMEVNQLSEINITLETFRISLNLTLAWEATKHDADRYKEYLKDKFATDLFKHDLNPLPLLTITNGKEITTNIQKSGVMWVGGKTSFGQPVKELQYEYMNYYVYKIQGTFQENFELESFPMDCQDLQINFECSKLASRIKFWPFIQGHNNAHLKVSSIDIDEYEIKNWTCDLYLKDYGDANNIVSKNIFHCLNYRVKLSRNYQVYFWKIWIYMFIIALSAFFVFQLDSDEDLGEKYGLCFGLLLAAVATQFVVTTWVPNLSYLTLLDKYTIFSFVTIFFVTLVVFLFRQFGVSSALESFLGNIFLGAWLLLNVIFLIYAYVSRRLEMRKIHTDYFDEKNSIKPEDRKTNMRVNKVVIEDRIYKAYEDEKIHVHKRQELSTIKALKHFPSKKKDEKK